MIVFLLLSETNSETPRLYSLNSRKSLRENLTQSRERSDGVGVSVPLGPLGHSTHLKPGDGANGVHIVRVPLHP